VLAAVLEAVVRQAADNLDRAAEPDWLRQFVSRVATALRHLQTTAPPAPASASTSSASSARVSRQQQQQQQAAVSMPLGLMPSCFKALSKCLDDRSAQPASVLENVARLASLCPGFEVLVDSATTQFP
jgi:hypothetical protein